MGRVFLRFTRAGAEAAPLCGRGNGGRNFEFQIELQMEEKANDSAKAKVNAWAGSNADSNASSNASSNATANADPSPLKRVRDDSGESLPRWLGC